MSSRYCRTWATWPPGAGSGHVPRRIARTRSPSAATATSWAAGRDEFAARLFADLKTPELGAFVAGLDCVLARLADAVPTRPADTG